MLGTKRPPATGSSDMTPTQQVARPAQRTGTYRAFTFDRAKLPHRHRRHFTFSLRTREVVYPLHDISSPEAAEALIDRSLRTNWSGYVHAHIELAWVQLTDIQPLSGVLDPQRYESVRRHHELLRRDGLPAYIPTAVRFSSERTYRVSLPPVVEKHGGTFLVVDGTHRLRLLVEEGIPEAVCIVVSGPHLPEPPSIPREWADVHVLPKYKSRSKKFRNLRRSWFRPTGAFLRGDRFDYDTVRAIRRDCFDALAWKERPPHLRLTS
jgi:hypothetical protein